MKFHQVAGLRLSLSGAICQESTGRKEKSLVSVNDGFSASRARSGKPLYKLPTTIDTITVKSHACLRERGNIPLSGIVIRGREPRRKREGERERRELRRSGINFSRSTLFRDDRRIARSSRARWRMLKRRKGERASLNTPCLPRSLSHPSPLPSDAIKDSPIIVNQQLCRP